MSEPKIQTVISAVFYVFLITCCALVENHIVSAVACIGGMLVYAFVMSEVHLAGLFGLWLIWYASIELPAMIDDSYGVAVVILTVASIWVGAGGEQRIYSQIRPAMAIFVILLNCCVGFTIKNKAKYEIRVGMTLLYGMCSAGLVLLDRKRNVASATTYHILATVWILTSMSAPVAVSNVALGILGAVIAVKAGFFLAIALAMGKTTLPVLMQKGPTVVLSQPKPVARVHPATRKKAVVSLPPSTHRPVSLPAARPKIQAVERLPPSRPPPTAFVPPPRPRPMFSGDYANSLISTYQQQQRQVEDEFDSKADREKVQQAKLKIKNQLE